MPAQPGAVRPNVTPAGARSSVDVDLLGGLPSAASFNVGATLHVGATQASGTYSGTFAVTVNYN